MSLTWPAQRGSASPQVGETLSVVSRFCCSWTEHFCSSATDQPQRVSENPLKRNPALLYSGNNSAQPGFGQDNACCRFPHIGSGRDGNADLRLALRG